MIATVLSLEYYWPALPIFLVTFVALHTWNPELLWGERRFEMYEFLAWYRRWNTESFTRRDEEQR